MFASIRRQKALLIGIVALFALPLSVRSLYRYAVANQVSALAAQVANTDVAFTLFLDEVHRIGNDGAQQTKLARRIIIAKRSDGARSETEIVLPGQPQEYRIRSIRLNDFRHSRAYDSLGRKTTGVPWPNSL